jgi:FkbM family methyltransferase
VDLGTEDKGSRQRRAVVANDMTYNLPRLLVRGQRLKQNLIELIRSPMRSAGFDIKRYRPEDSLRVQLRDVLTSLRRFRRLELDGVHRDDDRYKFVDFCLRNFRHSYSQLQQDLFVQYRLAEKASGFFVEFGASDGVFLSNTYMLETRFQWSGILSEPGKVWQSALTKNRRCTLDFRCVWDKSGEQLLFNESPIPECSTAEPLSVTDPPASPPQDGSHYAVETVRLTDLLDQHNAPKHIDYLSIDTEGSELKILDAFDFDKYDVEIITVEHNNTSYRQRLHRLLSTKGYTRQFEEFSFVDDWYVKHP